jgi:hypothetical protein
MQTAANSTCRQLSVAGKGGVTQQDIVKACRAGAPDSDSE